MVDMQQSMTPCKIHKLEAVLGATRSIYPTFTGWLHYEHYARDLATALIISVCPFSSRVKWVFCHGWFLVAAYFIQLSHVFHDSLGRL